MKLFRTILFMLLLLLITFFTASVSSFKTVMLIYSVLFLIMAILFHYDNSFYYKFIKFMNYRGYEIINSKDDTYKRKNLRMNIICYYLLSGIMFLNAIFTSNQSLDFWFSGTKQLVFIITIGLIYCITIVLVSNKLLSVSKTNKKFVIFSIISGIVIGTIFFIVITYYIFSLSFI